MKRHKVVLGLPWYGGPDIDCFPLYFEMLHYLGRLRERSHWYGALGDSIPETLAQIKLDRLVPTEADDAAEYRPSDGEFEFWLAVETRMSLPGLARERVVDMAQSAGADWLFMWDHDMRFPLSVFLRLLRHNKPVVGALGFTARDPIQPCLYRIQEGFDVASQKESLSSETVFDYPVDKLISDEDVDGKIAFGAGVVLYNMNVFRQIPKPWFNSTGCGEDWFFCTRAAEHNIPRYVDPTIPIQHKQHKAFWYDSLRYQQNRLDNPAIYEKLKQGVHEI